MVTELDIEEIVPHRKFVPMLRSADMRKVMMSTGTSAKVFEVKVSTATMMTAAMTVTTFISASSCASSLEPASLEM